MVEKGISRIRFNPDSDVSALGRNGIMSGKGIDLFYSLGGKAVILQVVNSKGPGRCFVELPADDLPEVIAALQEYQNNAHKAQEHAIYQNDRV